MYVFLESQGFRSTKKKKKNSKTKTKKYPKTIIATFKYTVGFRRKEKYPSYVIQTGYRNPRSETQMGRHNDQSSEYMALTPGAFTTCQAFFTLQGRH